MKRTFLAAVLGTLSFTGLVYAGDPAPVAPSAPAMPAAHAMPAAPATDEAKAAPATTETAEAPKAATPFHVMMGWLAKQVAPTLANPCPATAEGEKAWRGWFDGGKDVPAASLRDAMVAEGFTADKFVAFFQEMAKASCADGKCSEGKCADGKCEGGKCEGGKCAGCKAAAEKAAPSDKTAPSEAMPAGKATSDATPAPSDAKPSCGGCPSKRDAATPVAPTAPKP